MVELTRGPRVLHIGACGNVKPSGHALRHFAQAALVEAGFSVLAADVNGPGLAWMKEMGYEVAYLDAENIPADGETFDTIFAGELIEHLSNPGAFLAGCAQRLKPGGVLVLSTPQPFNPMHLGIYVFGYPTGFNLEHACWFDRQTLDQLLRRFGFVVDTVDYVDDIRIESTSALFGVFARGWLAIRGALPRRFRSTLVVSAHFRGQPDAPTSRNTPRHGLSPDALERLARQTNLADDDGACEQRGRNAQADHEPEGRLVSARWERRSGRRKRRATRVHRLPQRADGRRLGNLLEALRDRFAGC